MLIPDVNVILNARSQSARGAREASNWLAGAATGRETLGIPGVVLSSFVRIATNPKMAANLHTPAQALNVCQAIRAMPAFMELNAGPRHWPIFEGLVLTTGITSKDVSDAYLAAFAIENNATFVTFDRGFARFPGLRVFVPN
jgi:toxin-antitoxin system PIN domain toxin